MQPIIRVYLSEQMAARLAAAAKRSRDTKSALVEAALDRFLGSDDDIDDNAAVARSLAALSRQIERLDQDLRIVNETVALHARFHLAAAPPLPAAILRTACKIGSARFEEFAAQVARRIHLGTPLMRETMNRLDAAPPTTPARDLGEGEPPEAKSTSYEPGRCASTGVGDVSEDAAAVLEDGSNNNFSK